MIADAILPQGCNATNLQWKQNGGPGGCTGPNASNIVFDGLTVSIPSPLNSLNVTISGTPSADGSTTFALHPCLFCFGATKTVTRMSPFSITGTGKARANRTSSRLTAASPTTSRARASSPPYAERFELQTRQTPFPSAFPNYTDPYTGLSSCLSHLHRRRRSCRQAPGHLSARHQRRSGSKRHATSRGRQAEEAGPS